MNFNLLYDKIFEKFSITEIVIISGIIIFSCGMITGFIISNDVFYHKLENLINSGRYLLFNKKIYKIIEV